MTDDEGRAEKVHADVKAGFETSWRRDPVFSRKRKRMLEVSQNKASRSKELGKSYSIQNYFKENVWWTCTVPQFFAAVDASTLCLVDSV